MRDLILLLTTLALGCAEKTAATCDTAAEDADNDGDGYSIADGDCDDCDDRVYPGAVEESETDAWDQNCDGPGE